MYYKKADNCDLSVKAEKLSDDCRCQTNQLLSFIECSFFGVINDSMTNSKFLCFRFLFEDLSHCSFAVHVCESVVYG